jgi:hypothetical protein
MNRLDYRSRLADERLTELLSAFGGVLITGPKWCGKSWTASMQANSDIYIGFAHGYRQICTPSHEATVAV